MQKALSITPELEIPLEEFDESFLRSSGPGGQHVNKNSTAVQLRFDVRHSRSIDDAVRARLTAIAGNRMTRAGVLVITARRFRSREQNRRDALQRVARLVRRATIAPRPRKRTRPSKAARQRRLDDKRKRGSLKRLRGRPSGSD